MASASIGRALATALKELEGERNRIEKAISELKGLLADVAGSGRSGRRVGRPKGKIKRKRGPGRPPGRRRKGWSASARRKAKLRMKRWWAEQHKKGASTSQG